MDCCKFLVDEPLNLSNFHSSIFHFSPNPPAQRNKTPIEDQSLLVFPQCKPIHHGGASGRTLKGQEDTGERDAKNSYNWV